MATVPAGRENDSSSSTPRIDLVYLSGARRLFSMHLRVENCRLQPIRTPS